VITALNLFLTAFVMLQTEYKEQNFIFWAGFVAHVVRAFFASVKFQVHTQVSPK
jgi:hypothetical protein